MHSAIHILGTASTCAPRAARQVPDRVQDHNTLPCRRPLDIRGDLVTGGCGSSYSPGSEMRQKPGTAKPTAEMIVKDIRRRTRKPHSAEGKIRIALEGPRGEDSIAEPCRQEWTATRPYSSRSNEFLESGKERLAGDAARQV